MNPYEVEDRLDKTAREIANHYIRLKNEMPEDGTGSVEYLLSIVVERMRKCNIADDIIRDILCDGGPKALVTRPAARHDDEDPECAHDWVRDGCIAPEHLL